MDFEQIVKEDKHMANIQSGNPVSEPVFESMSFHIVQNDHNKGEGIL